MNHSHWNDVVPIEVQQEIGPPYNWCVLSGYTGSHAYGTYVPPEHEFGTDDIDIMGVVIPPVEYYLGFRKMNPCLYQKGKWDILLYEFRHFVSLLLKGNPNVIGMLWLRPEDYLIRSPVMDELIANRHLFCGKHVFDSFRGYASGQLYKMKHAVREGYMGEKRRKLVERFGYDVKNAAHMIRLLRMGQEFLKTGTLQVYRTDDAQQLIEIKTGLWPLDRVMDLAHAEFDWLDAAYAASTLPEKPQTAEVEARVISILKGRI
jgi:predicted nucleotidyltransferase